MPSKRDVEVRFTFDPGRLRWLGGVLVFFIVLYLLLQTSESPNNFVTSTTLAGAATTTQPPLPVVGDPPILMIVLNDRTCSACDTREIVQTTQTKIFPTVEVEEVDISSERGKRLLSELGLNTLPAYIFNASVEGAGEFSNARSLLVKVGGRYVINPSASKVGRFIEPPGEDDDPVLGDPGAPVTIIAFSEFECPFCGRFAQDTLSKLKEEYIDTGKARLVFRDFPLSKHDHAMKAAEAAECADDQGMFWEYHDLLFQNQQELGVNSLRKYARDIGLDMGEFNQCLDSGENTEEVMADIADGSNVGVSGTPQFFINGKPLEGDKDYIQFQELIEDGLKKIA
ncbi:MAG: thioredoxin domain-containing protein [Candidatus Altiarchaeales archaeon]|nr:thioredoxin domain-containing protein [Candidatus Altiarchaeales archaeon]MBD3416474.1 thioredoxin domain-containing protein [Candidatus Altiarchaeales archaeon]